MYKTILFPTDGSDLSDKAAGAAIELAKSLDAKLIVWAGAEIYTLPVAMQASVDQNLLYAEALNEAQSNVDAVVARAAAAGVSCGAATSVTDSPWQSIIQAADDHACDLIFMGSHGRRGVAALLLGSQTQKVLTHSSLPVLVYR